MTEILTAQEVIAKIRDSGDIEAVIYLSLFAQQENTRADLLSVQAGDVREAVRWATGAIEKCKEDCHGLKHEWSIKSLETLIAAATRQVPMEVVEYLKLASIADSKNSKQRWIEKALALLGKDKG